MGSLIAIDIGGTFTDLTAYDPSTGNLVFAKTSTTAAPDEGAIKGLGKIKAAGVDVGAAEVLKHGTTVVINSILERRGARTALVTTEGFRDILEIGRGSRPESFNLFYKRLPPFVPRERRYEIRERLNARGEVLTPLDREALPALAKALRDTGIEAVAVCFLHAYRNPVHENAVADYLRGHTDCFVSTSNELSREFREYERTSTTVINAFVGPRTSSYIDRFQSGVAHMGFDGRLLLMGSNGGVLTASEAIRRPVLLIESGPVGGAAGAAELGKITGNPNVIAFDMGGTTAKAVMIENGEAAIASIYYAAGYNLGYPVQAAVLDIVEVGAGGGSIAWTNELGALVVGPRSAGGVPGPVCYGTGGTEPTVTDANLVLGRLNPGRFLDGEMPLDVRAAESAIGDLAEQLGEPLYRVAAGIINLTALTMASAVKMTTIERGHEPRDFVMIAYGGAGPLHAAQVAREIGCRTVMIPRHPGHFCAYGMLCADLRYDLVQTMTSPLDKLDLAGAEGQFADLEREGKALLDGTGIALNTIRVTRYADMRYHGQEHTIKIKLPATFSEANSETLRELFEAEYRTRYGHSSEGVPVDIVNLRLIVDGVGERPRIERMEALVAAPLAKTRDVNFDGLSFSACDVWWRDDLPVNARVTGPAIIEEGASTTLLFPGDAATIDEFGNIVITIGESS